EVDYIVQSTHPTKRKEVDHPGVKSWAEKSEWLGLEVLHVQDGLEDDLTGQVEFVANYREKGERTRYHEIAEFKKENDQWFFVDGKAPKPETVVRQSPKVGRNDQCPCGSGKKFKKCCY
ncbi:YchJ family metal-binding protein, partial [Desulfobacterales bacterium HSG17]|nr:YchJ family metal-binding protein [Desulfobacterales bacterium HSG17]